MRACSALSVVMLATLATLAALAVAPARARADLDGDVFTSPDDHLRLDVPRGWRVSDRSGYPHVLLTLSRSKPRARLQITVDAIVPGCRTVPDAVFCSAEPTAALARLRDGLEPLGARITAQLEGRSPELEYQAGRRFVRHALVVIDDRVISVILSTDRADDRTALRRTFDRLVQSVRPVAR